MPPNRTHFHTVSTFQHITGVMIFLWVLLSVHVAVWDKSPSARLVTGHYETFHKQSSGESEKKQILHPVAVKKCECGNDERGTRCAEQPLRGEKRERKDDGWRDGDVNICLL